METEEVPVELLVAGLVEFALGGKVVEASSSRLWVDAANGKSVPEKVQKRHHGRNL